MRASPIAILALAFMAAHALAADSDWNLCAFATDYDQRIGCTRDLTTTGVSRLHKSSRPPDISRHAR